MLPAPPPPRAAAGGGGGGGGGGGAALGLGLGCRGRGSVASVSAPWRGSPRPPARARGWCRAPGRGGGGQLRAAGTGAGRWAEPRPRHLATRIAGDLGSRRSAVLTQKYHLCFLCEFCIKQKISSNEMTLLSLRGNFQEMTDTGL